MYNDTLLYAWGL